MHILRRIIVALLVSILPLLLFITATDLGLVETFGNPTQIKKIVATSGVYQNIVPAALNQASKGSGGGNNNSVSLSDPQVKTAAETTLSPSFVQQSTENVINGTFDWLNGKVSQPDFSIDLSGKKAEFAALVANQAQQTATSLPRCTRAQTEAINNQGGNFDVFNISCLPIGTTPASIAANVQSQLANNQNFLKKTSITADSLKQSNSTTSVFSGKLKQVPKIYGWIKRSPFILAALDALVIAGVVFISYSRRKGVRRSGIVLTVMGVIILAYSWGINFAITKKVLPKIKITNSTFATDVKAIATQTTHAVDKYFWIVGAIYLVLGVSAIILAWKFHKSPKAKNKVSPSSPDDATKDATPVLPSEKPEPKKIKINPVKRLF